LIVVVLVFLLSGLLGGCGDVFGWIPA